MSWARSAPLLSVIVPIYNGQPYLDVALQSVLNQSDESLELILSDDGSTDGSRDIIQRFARDNRVVALDGPAERNWVSNTNAAVARSRGRYVTILHQDDLWLPGRWAAFTESIAALPDCGIWINPSRFIDLRGRVVGTWGLPVPAVLQQIPSQEFIERLLVQNFLAMPAPIFPRAGFDQTGGLDESLWYTADWDFWLKLAARAPIGASPRITTAFRVHAGSQTALGVSAVETMRRQTETVRLRHLASVTLAKRRDATNRAGRFASEMNAAAASFMGGHPVRWQPLMRSLCGLRIRGARSFLANARFLERSLARFRVGLPAEVRRKRYADSQQT